MDPLENRALDDVAVLVPAGGAGRRMGGAPKQFRLLGGSPVLVQTLRALLRTPRLRALVVAVPAGEEEATEALLRGLGGGPGGLEASVVTGGASRQASVERALRAVPSACGLTLVHDAVRPFVSPQVLARVVDAASRYGAAAPAVPIADTLRGHEGSAFGALVDRESLLGMQTPQAALTAWLREALARAAEKGEEATDEVALIQASGREVRVVEGDGRMFKLTRPEDFALAEAFWPAWQRAQAWD